MSAQNNNSMFSKETSPEISELLNSLNPKQQAYVNLDLQNTKNGEYLLSVFRLLPGKNLNILQAASEVAAESSTGTNFKVNTETPFSREMNALVYQLDLEKNLVWIAYPWRLFDRRGNVQNILTYIVGNVLGMKEVSGLKLLDTWLPPSMLEQFDGPNYTLDDMRKYPDVFIHFHRAGHGGFTRPENPFGFTVLVLSKFARLAGVSGIHTGTVGVGGQY